MDNGLSEVTVKHSKLFSDKISFTLAIIFLIVALAMIVTIVCYYIYWKPVLITQLCNTNTECGVNQECLANSCVEQVCTADSNCNNGVCIGSFCYALSCMSGNDCPTGSACLNGNCVKQGNKCTSNFDCFRGSSCQNGVCAQCLANSGCPTGQGCFNMACRFPYAGETGNGLINFVSPAQVRGDITAPPGYFCTLGNCAVTGTNVAIGCSANTLCPLSCPFCVNDVCRCTAGALYESCIHNTDCASGVCMNGICVFRGGQCAYNYNGTGCTGCCHVSAPYCVNGICSPVSNGAICGSTGLPVNMCRDPTSLGAIGSLEDEPNGMGFFCVNGRCQTDPGQYNQLCVQGSCEFLESSAFICTGVNGGNIELNRCLRI